MGSEPGSSVGDFVTPRLVLRRAVSADAQLRHRLWVEREPRTPAHRRLDAAGHPTVDELRSRLETEMAEAGIGLRTVVVRATGEPIGCCGLVAPQREDAAPEIAYELLRAHHGNGYATEAAGAVIAAAAASGIRRLEASVWDWNAASVRVLEKRGFVDTGTVTAVGEHGRSLLFAREL